MCYKTAALLTAFISLNAAQAASAADMVVKAPAYTPATAPWTWTGFYLGGHIGAALASTDIADPLGVPIYGDNVRGPGFIGGSQIGFNYQLGSIVFGVEADASWVDSDGTNTCFAVSGNTASSNCRVRADLYATATGRLGYAVDRSLLYVKGGAAWTRGSVDMFVNQNNAGVFTSTNSFVTPGWTVGGGLEYALTPNWSVRFEYDYLNFSGQDVATPYVAGNPFGTAPTTTISQHIHEMKLGLNYRFGPDAENWPASFAAVNPGAINTTADWEVEGGARAMYSWGRFQKDHGTGRADGSTLPNGMVTSRLTYDDTRTSSSELFARFDSPWNVFLKGYVGVGFTGSGNQTDEDSFVFANPPAPAPYSNAFSDKVNGHLNYAVLDLGYDFLKGPGYKAGAFVGYSYLDQFMNRYNCIQIANPTGSCEPPNEAPTPPNVVRFEEIDKWQSLRVGVAGETMLTDRLKLGGEVAYLPYVHFDGLDNHFRNPVVQFPASSNGGHGVQTEALLSYYLTDRFAIGIGARYWALWTTSGEFLGTPPGPPRYYRAAFEQAGAFVQTSYTFGGDGKRAYASALPYKAAPAGTHDEWSGFYAGIVGGGEWGRSKHVNSSNDITQSFDVNGALLGATMGYNAQFAGNWLFGLEGDMSWSNGSGKAFDIPPFNTARQSGTKEPWLATVRVRLGVVPTKHWLAYVTGGVALADVEAEIFNPEATFTESRVRCGWAAGAGVEYAITRNWSAKLEYLHAGLSDTSYFTPAPSAFTSNRGAGVPLDENIVRGGINYRFFQ